MLKQDDSTFHSSYNGPNIGQFMYSGKLQGKESKEKEKEKGKDFTAIGLLYALYTELLAKNYIAWL